MVNPVMGNYIGSIGISMILGGIIGGLFSFGALVSRPITSRIPKKLPINIITAVSSFVMAIISGAYFYVSPDALILLRFIHGFAFGVSTTCIMTMASRTFSKENMAQGMSYFGLGQGVSIALAPALGIALRNNFGFGSVFFVSSVLSLLVCLLLIFVKSTAANSKNIKSKFTKKLIPMMISAGLICFITSLETVFIIAYGEMLGVASLGWYFSASAVVIIVFRMVFAKRFNTLKYERAVKISLSFMSFAMLLIFLNSFFSSFWVFILVSVIKSIGQSVGQPIVQKQSIALTENKVAASSFYYFGCDVGQCLAPIIGGFIGNFFEFQFIFLFGGVISVIYIVLQRRIIKSDSSSL